MLSKEYLQGWKDHPEYYGELFGVNVDGSRSKYLMGYQGEQQTGSRLRKATSVYGTSYILDPLVDDERHMLVVTYPWGSKEPHTIVYEVDVYRGLRRQVTRSLSRMAQFLTDEQATLAGIGLYSIITPTKRFTYVTLMRGSGLSFLSAGPWGCQISSCMALTKKGMSCTPVPLKMANQLAFIS